MAAYNVHVIAACQAIPDRQYDSQIKAWTVSVEHLGKLEASLRAHQRLDATITELPKLVQRALEAK
jgi:hypothetical protein